MAEMMEAIVSTPTKSASRPQRMVGVMEKTAADMKHKGSFPMRIVDAMEPMRFSAN